MVQNLHTHHIIKPTIHTCFFTRKWGLNVLETFNQFHTEFYAGSLPYRNGLQSGPCNLTLNLSIAVERAYNINSAYCMFTTFYLSLILLFSIWQFHSTLNKLDVDPFAMNTKINQTVQFKNESTSVQNSKVCWMTYSRMWHKQMTGGFGIGTTLPQMQPLL